MAKNKNHYSGRSGILDHVGITMPNGRNIALNRIYDYAFCVPLEEFAKHYKMLTVKNGHLPWFTDVIKHLITDKFYKEEINKSIMMPKRLEEIYHQIDYQVMPAIGKRFNKEAVAGAKPSITITETEARSMMLLMQEYLIVGKDGSKRHMADPILRPPLDCEANGYDVNIAEQEMDGQERLWEEMPIIYRRDEFYGRCLAKGLEEVLRRQDELEKKDFDFLVDWYLRDRGLQDNPFGSELIGRLLFDLSQSVNKVEKDLALAVYEDHSESMEIIFRRYPNYNYIIKGSAEEYSSLANFLSRSPEVRDLFVEQANLTRVEYYRKYGRHITKSDAEKRLHLEMALEAMERFFNTIKKNPDFSGIHVLNLMPNEIYEVNSRTIRPTYGNYIAIAFKYGGAYYILVDSIVKGAAVYLWRGKSYNRGLETLKMARTYVREEPDVLRAYHTKLKGEPKPFYEIYSEILKKGGLHI